MRRLDPIGALEVFPEILEEQLRDARRERVPDLPPDRRGAPLEAVHDREALQAGQLLQGIRALPAEVLVPLRPAAADGLGKGRVSVPRGHVEGLGVPHVVQVGVGPEAADGFFLRDEAVVAAGPRGQGVSWACSEDDEAVAFRGWFVLEEGYDSPMRGKGRRQYITDDMTTGYHDTDHRTEYP